MSIFKDAANLAENAARDVGRAAESAARDVGRAAESAAKDVARAAESAVKTVVRVGETVGDVTKVVIGGVVVPIAKGIANSVDDGISRAGHAVAGRLNFDIIRADGGPKVPDVGALREGDILLKQGNWKVAITGVIGVGQLVLNRSGHPYIGAGLLGHATVYIGNDEVIEAVGNGVVVSAMSRYCDSNETDYRKYNWYVIRPKSEVIAKSIVAAAWELVGDRTNQVIKVGYDHASVGFAALAGRTGAAAEAYKAMNGDITKSFRERLRRGEKLSLFCSELAVYCLNCAAADNGMPAFIKEAQTLISPEELYVELREDTANFTYVGELHKRI